MPPGFEAADLLRLHIPGMDLAVDADLAHPARNQLGVLGTEIQDQDAVGVDVIMGWSWESIDM